MQTYRKYPFAYIGINGTNTHICIHLSESNCRPFGKVGEMTSAISFSNCEKQLSFISMSSLQARPDVAVFFVDIS